MSDSHMGSFHPRVLCDVLNELELREELQHIAASRAANAAHKDLQLSSYVSYETVEKTFKLKLVSENDGILIWAENGEEVVLYAQGFLAELTLPPVTRASRINPKAAHRTFQYVKLIGPQSEAFEAGMQAVRAIYRFSEQQFGQGAVLPFEEGVYGDQGALVARTRYLNPARYSAFEDVAIPTVLDPEQLLATLVQSGNYKHTVDNVVQYLMFDVNHAHQSAKAVPADPSVFRVGQLVEVGLSFRVVRSRSVTGVARYRFVTKLDSLLLISRNGAMRLAERVAILKASRALNEQPLQIKLGKRRLIYEEDEDVVLARKKLRDMQID
ncbi:hypothetical protein OH77DRAFT_1416997 [Trametes cingulata]|nr:hypothetical protein OH77DRAFT_1416997 [Trametes cingulata]